MGRRWLTRKGNSIFKIALKCNNCIFVSSSCPARPAPCGWDSFNWPGENPQLLLGALVSGPDENDHYMDKREEYVYNEVTLDYNAGFQSAVAGLRHLQLKSINSNNT